MTEVARSIVLNAGIPHRHNRDEWAEYLVAMCVSFRRALLQHPNAAPILLEFAPRDLSIGRHDDTCALLRRAGVASHLHILILNGLEHLTLGSGLTQAAPQTFARADPQREPSLTEAVKANPWPSSDELFAESVRAFLHGASRRP
jgi:hypothetical protein